MAPGVEDNLLESEFPNGSPKAAIANAGTLTPAQKEGYSRALAPA